MRGIERTLAVLAEAGIPAALIGAMAVATRGDQQTDSPQRLQYVDLSREQPDRRALPDSDLDFLRSRFDLLECVRTFG